MAPLFCASSAADCEQAITVDDELLGRLKEVRSCTAAQLQCRVSPKGAALSDLSAAPIAFFVKVQEARLLASLRHPNIVQFMGLCTEPACIITELCGRGSLTDVIRSAKASPADLPWPRRLDMVRRVGRVGLHGCECGFCWQQSCLAAAAQAPLPPRRRRCCRW